MSGTQGSTAGKTKRLSGAARARVAVALLVGACLGLVGVAVAGQAPVPPGLQFLQVGHWVYSSSSQSAVHVDGSTSQVDAQASVPGAAPDSQVVQGDRSGYVVERSRITVFSKSTLSVQSSLTPPATEQPVTLEVSGGPYLVYRNAGQVVRLGDPVATVPAGGPLSRPVATGDGTVWLHRIDSGAICELPRAATQFTCPAQLPPGHSGELTVVDDQPVLLDTTAGTLRPVGRDGLGEATAIGVELSSGAQVADSAVDGRLAVADPGRKQLVLIDTAGVGSNRPAAKPVTVDLAGDARYAGPATTAHTIALVDETHHEVVTYDSRGTRRHSEKVPGDSGTPRLARGEDTRVYVDSPDGSHVLVVNGDDGSLVAVQVDGGREHRSSAQPTGGTATGSATAATSSAPPETSTPETTTPPPSTQDASPTRTAPRPAATQPPVAAATPPGAPPGVTATAGDGSAAVTWGAAAPNGAPVTAYHLSWSGGSMSVPGSARAATVSGLANGTEYVIAVAAENAAGRGSAASSAALVPGRPAAAPNVTASESFAGVTTVDWTQPDLGGGALVHYVVSAAGQPDQIVTGLTAQFTTIGVTISRVTVRAVTRLGPPGSPTLDGAPGTAPVATPLSFPSVQISRVAFTGKPGELAVTITADGNGSQAYCRAGTSQVDLGAEVPCGGRQDLLVTETGTVIGAGYSAFVTIRNTTGNGQPADWFGMPESAPKAVISPPSTPSGGYVFWIVPVALWGARRRKGTRQP